ncbi:hypothetical protein U2I54_15420 [Bacillus pseudomycoides]|uniref:Uncharacterized protein n=1 Tax=Bacillus bingmayongensis TaxID=1150157 RepID=A0ABU5JYB0_9BACI|nr:hypothetical protein [Bacillus pseudomycoides]
MTAPVLQKDLKKKQILDEFIEHCKEKQSAALKVGNEKEFYTWVKEARLARRELAAIYRAKEKHDEELARDKTLIQKLIRHLRSRGIDASVVERAHYITFEG